MKTLLAIALLSLFCCSASTRAATQSDAQQIRSLLSSTFDKPEAKVVADPIVISEKHAIASWTQGETGGRALLRKEKDKWTLVACAGDALKEAGVLESGGIPKASAVKLVRQLEAAEAKIPAERRKLFSLFGPMVQAEAAHAPGTAHNH